MGGGGGGGLGGTLVIKWQICIQFQFWMLSSVVFDDARCQWLGQPQRLLDAMCLVWRSGCQRLHCDQQVPWTSVCCQAGIHHPYICPSEVRILLGKPPLCISFWTCAGARCMTHAIRAAASAIEQPDGENKMSVFLATERCDHFVNILTWWLQRRHSKAFTWV